MKIRNGFVSNSSSSSYIVSVGTMESEEIFYNKLFNCLVNMIEYKDENKQKYNKLEHEIWNDNNGTITKAQFELMKEYSIEILNKNNIKIHKNDNFYNFECFTIMHNSYKDMSDLLKSLYFEFKENYQFVSFKREEG